MKEIYNGNIQFMEAMAIPMAPIKDGVFLTTYIEGLH